MPGKQPITSVTRIGTEHPPSLLTFRGGLNNSLPDEEIGANEASAIRNWIPDYETANGIIKREGFSTVSSAMSARITSIHDGKYEHYFTCGTTIRDFDGNSLDTGLTDADDPDWVTFKGNDIMCNGTEVRTTTDGLTFGALGGSPPAFKYMTAHNGFLFGGGHSGGILRWADYDTVTSWTSTNALIVTNDNHDPTMGLTRFRNSLINFCRYSFHHVTGFATEDMGINYSSFGTGTTSHRSIVVTPMGLFWWSDNGLVYSPTGTEDGIRFPLLEKIPLTLHGLNRNYYHLVHGVWNPRKNRVEFHVPNGSAQTTSNMRIDFDYSDDTVWVHDGVGTQMGASGPAEHNGSISIYVGSASASGGYLYLQDDDALTDNGTPISAYVETRRDAPVSAKAIKRPKAFSVQTSTTGNSSIDYSVYIDNNGTPDKSWPLALTGSSGFIIGTDRIGFGVLGSGIVPADPFISYPQKYRKIKHRVFDSAAFRTRIRAVLNSGYLIST